MWCDVFTRVTCQMHVRGMSTKEPNILWQKSPVYSDKIALYRAATCVWCDVFTRVKSCSWDVYKRDKRALHFLTKKALYFDKRAQYILRKEPYILWQKSPIYCDKRALKILTKGPYTFWQKSPTYFDKKTLYILTKEPYIFGDMPRAYQWDVTWMCCF